jgi:SAM-dependent methyltransferase
MSRTADPLREGNRAIWSRGDWDKVSRIIAGVGPHVLDLAGVEPGMDLLDVGTGSGGTLAIPAAQRGARVVASDITDSWFAAGRRRAEEAGVQLEWVEATVEELPFEDASFDRVCSTFGHMFAPRHDRAAAELARVCRPGGTIAVATWIPEAYTGEMFTLVGGFMPPPPEGVQPPALWGVPEHVTEMLAPHGVELEFHRATADFRADSEEEFERLFLDSFGPLVTAHEVLPPERWEELRERYRDLVHRHNVATDGTAHLRPDYLVTLGRKL